MKYSWLFFLLINILVSCTSTGAKSGRGLSLQNAIEQSAEKTTRELPKGSRIAIVAFESENDNLSEFIMEELYGALLDQGMEVVDRKNLAYVYQELDFQMSGNVSDATACSIGKFLGANIVIIGQLTGFDNLYRYRINCINVETSARISITRLDIKDDTEIRRMNERM